MKDPQAAPALAARIADHRYSQLACDALRAMGPAAEDALIAVAETPDPQVCLTAIVLLGDVGTEKCFKVMHKADASRNRARANGGVGRCGEDRQAAVGAQRLGIKAEELEVSPHRRHLPPAGAGHPLDAIGHGRRWANCPALVSTPLSGRKARLVRNCI